jgi:hypothetical protein
MLQNLFEWDDSLPESMVKPIRLGLDSEITDDLDIVSAYWPDVTLRIMGSALKDLHATVGYTTDGLLYGYFGIPSISRRIVTKPRV